MEVTHECGEEMERFRSCFAVVPFSFVALKYTGCGMIIRRRPDKSLQITRSYKSSKTHTSTRAERSDDLIVHPKCEIAGSRSCSKFWIFLSLTDAPFSNLWPGWWLKAGTICREDLLRNRTTYIFRENVCTKFPVGGRDTIPEVITFVSIMLLSKPQKEICKQQIWNYWTYCRFWNY